MADIVVEREAGVVTLTLNRPDTKNAITAATFQELRDLFIEVGDRARPHPGVGRSPLHRDLRQPRRAGG